MQSRRRWRRQRRRERGETRRHAASGEESPCAPAEKRTDFRAGSTPDTESASDAVIAPGLSERGEPPAPNVPRLLGRSLSISRRSFPGKEVVAGADAGILGIDLGVAGPLDVCVASVERDASDADVTSVALSAVGGRVGFLSDERAGGGGSTTADMDARRAWRVGRARRGLCARASILWLTRWWCERWGWGDMETERAGRAWGVREMWRPMAICSIVGRVSGLSWKLYGEGDGGLLSAGVEYMPPSCHMKHNERENGGAARATHRVPPLAFLWGVG